MLDTLDNLKAFVLPNSLQAETDYDAALRAIGEGVASAFDQHCNRRLSRVSGDTYETNGDRTIIVLPRYPVESLDAVELQRRNGDAWEDQDDVVASFFPESGVVLLEYALGDYKSRIRFTFTGGYWYDDQGGQSQPAGSTALPAHVLLAWKLQCKHVWESIDKTGSSLAQENYVSRLANLQLIPDVVKMLQGERRQG